MVRLMTPEYASPEQVRGEPVTTATDVYSLGVVLYGLLTGQKPYRVTSRTPHDMVQAVLEAAPESPSTVNRRLRGDLDNIVLKALRKEPERRYASVEQFSEDIRRHLEGLPVIARPDTLAYRGSKFVRRHKWAVIAAGLVVLALLGGMAATLREASIAQTERESAERRFNDVRQLANSLLFEVYDAIENLPGATPARKLLVDRAMQYLDKLANEAKGDLVCNGSWRRPMNAWATFKADFEGRIWAIRRVSLRATGKPWRFGRRFVGRPGKCRIPAGVVSDASAAERRVDGHGRSRRSVDQVKQMLPIAEKLAADDPNNLTNRRNLAGAHLDYGWKRSGLGDWKDGLEECRKRPRCWSRWRLPIRPTGKPVAFSR